MRIFILDNYDSFTYNLYQLFTKMGTEVNVFRNDSVGVASIMSQAPDAIIISPGPKAPSDSGISKDVVKVLGRNIPLLGVCLGMQVINEVFGGKTILAPRPVHGEKDLIFHRGSGLFESVPSPFFAARYHSLATEVKSEELDVVAVNGEGLVMAIEHKKYPIAGVQFHPESFMTEYGERLAQNFIRMVKDHGNLYEDQKRLPVSGRLLEPGRQN